MREAAASAPPASPTLGPVPLASASPRPTAARLLLESALVALASVALAAWALGLWRADLGLPLRYAPVDDTKFYLMLAKAIIDHGSYLTNATLGVPFGQQLADYPQGADDLNLLLIRGFAVFCSNPALVLNLFFLATFALAALTAHLALRAEGVSAPVAGVASVLFSLLPYHFFRGESHLLLSAYYSVPLCAHLFLRILAGRPLFARRVAPDSRRITVWVSKRSLVTLVVCVVIGCDNLYYATFAAILLAAAILISAGRRKWPAVLGGMLALGLIALTLSVNLAPTLIYRSEHGVNPRLERSAAADERSNEALSLRLSSLILPAPNGRIRPLAELGARYDKAIAPGYCEGCYASLGVIGSVGFLWLVVCALGTLAGAGAWYGSRRPFRHAALGAALAFAVGTVGGISSLIEFFVTPDIRGWNRISLLIAFFSLLSASLLLESLRRRLDGGRCGRVQLALILIAVLAFGAYDQAGASDAPAYAPGYREYHSDARFVSEIQARLPGGAAVFQLPYVPFPEGYPDTQCCGPVPTYATKYESLRGYLHSSSLRWSYGAIKGRAADWSAQLAGQPLAFLLAAVATDGFDGLWVDPAGFEPFQASRLQAALGSLLHQSPLLSPDHDLWFFDLRRYGSGLQRSQSPARLALLRARTLQPLRTVCAPGGVKVINPSSFPRPAELAVHLASSGSELRRVTFVPGPTLVKVSSPGRILYATATDDGLASFGAGSRPADRLVVGLTGPGCPG